MSHRAAQPVESRPAQSDTLIGLVQRIDAQTARSTADLERRGISYLQSGYPLHLRGPAGSGKTTLALRIASQLKRPVMLLVGDASFDTRRLVGHEEVTRTKRVVDRYISSVVKVENQSHAVWLDRALTVACTDGCTLVYDEFNRAPAAANNVLLTVLEERLLALGKSGRGENYMPVHPEFRAIFTSNPTDHVGTNLTQDALTDRMITIDVDAFDRDAEVAIVVARSGLKTEEAGRVVDIVRDFRMSREYAQRPTLRASIMIAHIAALQNLRLSADEPRFVELCLDVLASKLKPGSDGRPDPRQSQSLVELISHFCSETIRVGQPGVVA
ncbi:MAG TPA: gas vesicle protein GvpN [Rhodopila sp.]|nr:gas vesicle protein GvpN [Rhodopila sp.]